MRVAVCQVNSRADRAANLAAARDLLRRAAEAGADLAVLPEYVDYLGPTEGEPKAEPTDGEFASFFADAARELRMWVLAGSFHESGRRSLSSQNRGANGSSRASAVFRTGARARYTSRVLEWARVNA